MTVSSQISRIEQLGDGTTTAFAVSFYFLADSDLKVFVDGVQQTIVTNYTVTGAGNPSGGSVNFVSAPANGVEVVIFRDPALTQGLDYIDNDPFPAESHERGLDKLTMIAQRIRDLVSRALRLGDSVVGVNTELPALTGSQLLGTNPGGTGFQLYPLGSTPQDSGSTVYTPSGTGALATTVEKKLRESVSLFDFLTTAQIADVQTNALAIDLTVPIQAALNSGAKRIKAPAGSYLHQKLIIPEGVQLYGEGIRFTKFICFNIIGDVHIELGVKGKLADIYFSPQSKPLLYDNLPSVTHPMVREGAFNYNDDIDAVLMGSGSKVVDCEFDGFRYGIYGNQGKSNLTVIDTISRAGRWGMYFYIVDGVKVRGGKSVGGNEGGLSLVSSRRCSVSGVTVINPNGTGINTGGSSGGDVPGGASFDKFNASEITITNNIVYARDCINSENGVDGYTVTNNICRVVSELTTNGVGVSAQNRDATGGRIRNVTISANDVNSYDYSREYSTGILVGAAGANSPDVPVDQVSVTGNVVQNSNQAYRFESINSNFVQGLTVSGNVGKPSRTGIYLDRVKRACVSGNSISRNTGTTDASTFGVIVSEVDRSTIIGNCVKGMAEHVSQSKVCTETYVYDLISEPNDDLGGYQVFVNTSGGAPVGFALSGASPKAYIAFDGNNGNAVNRLFASVVKNAVGDYTINWAIPFQNANYIVQVTAGDTSAVGGPFGVRQIVSKTTTSFRFLLSASNGTLVDAGSVMVLALGS